MIYPPNHLPKPMPEDGWWPSAKTAVARKAWLGLFLKTALSLMRCFALIFAVLLAGCASDREVVVTPLPGAPVPIQMPDISPEPTHDYTINESSICEVHHTQMQRTVVPIGYGYILPDAQAQVRYEASKKAFPHAETWVAGGCCVMVGYSATNAVIYTCPECKKAASRWDSLHEPH